MDISVIVPTHNRQKLLKACLASLCTQDCPKDAFEIIVINDGSKDRTDDVTRSFQNSHDNLVYLKQDNKGVSAARNAGIKQARAPILAFLDDDCVAQKDWIRKIIEAHHKHPEEVVIMGKLNNANRHNIYGNAWEFILDTYIKRDLAETNGKYITLLGCAFSIKSDIMKKLGGFDENLRLAREDADLKFRLYEAGHKVFYEPSIQIKHNYRPNLLAYIRQHLNYGRGQYYLSKKWGNRTGKMEKHVNLKTPEMFRTLFKKFGIKGVFIYLIFVMRTKILMYGQRHETRLKEGAKK